MNAKTELIEYICQVQSKLKCAEITHYDEDWTEIRFILPINYSEEQYEAFLKALDFDYDSGYGMQELEGTLWFSDNIWCTRFEYDGSECWQHHSTPEIPSDLQDQNDYAMAG